MTARILQFTPPPGSDPITPFQKFRAVDDARIVTANPEWFARQDVATACLVLQAWGDEYDMLAGDAMMMAMEKPKREDYRAELPGLLIFAALTVGMMFAILGVGP